MVDPRLVLSGDVTELDGWSVRCLEDDVFDFVRVSHGIRVEVTCDVGKVIEYGLVLEDVLDDHMTYARSSTFSGVVLDYARYSADDIVPPLGDAPSLEDHVIDFGLWGES